MGIVVVFQQQDPLPYNSLSKIRQLNKRGKENDQGRSTTFEFRQGRRDRYNIRIQSEYGFLDSTKVIEIKKKVSKHNTSRWVYNDKNVCPIEIKNYSRDSVMAC